MGRKHWPLVCMRTVMVLALVCVSACSAMQHGPEETDNFFTDTTDPFNDPFFTDPPEWDQAMLDHSEVLSQSPNGKNDAENAGKESAAFDESETDWEKGEGMLFSTILVAATLGKMALLPLGLGF